jgi:hypothetical protein
MNKLRALLIVRAKCIYVISCLLCAVPVTYSQQSDCEQHAIIVNVRDKHGKFVPSLQAGDFRAKIGRNEASVASLNHGVSAPRVVILLDKSGSINSELKRVTEKSISSELIRSLPETTQFALVAFGFRVLETLKFGHSQAEIVPAIDRLTSSPGRRKDCAAGCAGVRK